MLHTMPRTVQHMWPSNCAAALSMLSRKITRLYVSEQLPAVSPLSAASLGPTRVARPPRRRTSVSATRAGTLSATLSTPAAACALCRATRSSTPCNAGFLSAEFQQVTCGQLQVLCREVIVEAQGVHRRYQYKQARIRSQSGPHVYKPLQYKRDHKWRACSPAGMHAWMNGLTLTGCSAGLRRAAMLSDSAAIRWHAYTAAAAAAACAFAEPALV